MYIQEPAVIYPYIDTPRAYKLLNVSKSEKIGIIMPLDMTAIGDDLCSLGQRPVGCPLFI